MEEEGAVKAPVTRLRRRLSVELSDDTKSPSAPSTPTKKRGGRLAAKPQLELIDEHAITNSPKRTTTKSISRDVAEVEERPVTPARRSTRIRSNTSLVSEVEEKSSTPAKRNARVKSNTSIVLEAAQAVAESPRAKRASRRNSLAGSDNEIQLTPARTRRTRKTSTSSIETEADATVEKPTSLITEIISEEPENKLRNSTSNDVSPTIRKSPRLSAKKNRKSAENTPSDNQSQTKSEGNGESNNENGNQTIKGTKMTTNMSEHNISLSSAKLIKDLDKDIRKTHKNKSMSDMEDIENGLNRRNRTKSWTNFAARTNIGNDFHSDNESVKKMLKQNAKLSNKKKLSNTGYGDGQEIMRKSTSFSPSSKVDKLEDSSQVLLKEADTSNESNKENLLNVSSATSKETNSGGDVLHKAYTGEIKGLYIEDTDSNIEGGSKHGKGVEYGDQCVPVVLNQYNMASSQIAPNSSKEPNIFAACITEKASITDVPEPMDIDESVPRNVSLLESEEENQNTSQKSVNESLTKKHRKSSLTVSSELREILENEDINENPEGKRSRKSSIRGEARNETLNTSKRKSLLVNTQEGQVSGSNDNDSTTVKNRKSSLSVTPNNNINDPKDNLNKSKRKSTLSESVVQNEMSEKDISNASDSISLAKKDKSKRKSSINIPVKDGQDGTPYKSKRASLSITPNPDLEKSGNENKSTLVLSQIKDISTTESNTSKSHETKELSKSMDIPEVIKEGLVNKNVTLNYLTSTPVQQKNLEKLAIQMNTSVITPTNSSKRVIKSKSNINKTNISSSKSSIHNSSSDSDEESDEDDLLDGQAEDAGDDYESGDSRDDEEILYEKQNEILTKGETLTSDDDISNDSDYEKDSFVVSSDNEDEELLSGSGDDLDMSDNELTMSSKSKKKYNERQSKEQKRASKEMYEARHGFKKSTSKSESNDKPNRSRLDSALFNSDEDTDNMPPKKTKRMRLESTLESSHLQSDLENTKLKFDTSIASEVGYKKKKSKRLSESVSNESVLAENEMTICNQNTSIRNDPLIVDIIKSEPKTPQTVLDISRVGITDDVEEVEVNENKSMMRFNETSDPLHMTMPNNEENGSDNEDSISENEEISSNYDSMLKSLNKDNKNKIKSHDISLNLNKKTKQRSAAIIDELNLTQTKTKKKIGKDDSFQAKQKTVKRVFKKLADNDESSDSIDLKLLFSDESSNDSLKQKDNDDTFIPLRKSIGKTDIRKSMDVVAENSMLNTSTKKKRKSSKNETVTNENDGDAEALSFFIDTKGELQDKKTKSEGPGDSDSDAPTEILYTSNKVNKVASGPEPDTCLPKTPMSGKKKKKSSESQKNYTKESEEPTTPNKPTGAKTPISENKKKKISETQEIDEHGQSNSKTPSKESKLAETEAKTPASGKKKKKSVSQENETVEIEESKTPNKQRELAEIQAKTPTSGKKKKKSVSQENETEEIEEFKTPNKQRELAEVQAKTPASGKKKKKLSESKENDIEEISKTPNKDSKLAETEAKTPTSGKKKKKFSESQEIDDGEETNINTSSKNTELAETEVKTTKSGKKKKLSITVDNHNESVSAGQGSENNVPDSKANDQQTSFRDMNVITFGEVSKKRKRNSSATHNEDAETIQGKINESVKGNKQKKIKVTDSVELEETKMQEHAIPDEQKNCKKGKKNKQNAQEINLSAEPIKKINKKRKERDDDESETISKVLKEHSFHEVHVPRLPSAVINELNDKPSKRSKASAVSTANFAVEGTTKRKNKPSVFLEESVYLNESETEQVTKKKTKLKKPKVLPFLPSASTSASGFTTTFQVNVISQNVEFVGQSASVPNFKNDILAMHGRNKIKKLRTYDLFKKQRNLKLTKY